MVLLLLLVGRAFVRSFSSSSSSSSLLQFFVQRERERGVCMCGQRRDRTRRNYRKTGASFHFVRFFQFFNFLFFFSSNTHFLSFSLLSSNQNHLIPRLSKSKRKETQQRRRRERRRQRRRRQRRRRRTLKIIIIIIINIT